MNSEKVKEVKKALECCANYNGQSRCKDCPIFAKCYEDENFMPRLALTLINELEECSEKWQKLCTEEVALNTPLKERIKELETLCNKTYEDLTKEIDRLESENEKLKQHKR